MIYDDTTLTSHTVGKETFPATNLRDCVVDQAGNGKITSRAQELAGPNGTGGYTPCTYAVTTAGIYDVVMYGTDGPGGNADGNPTSQIAQNSQNFDTSQGTSIAAWDVTVRPTTSATDRATSITGRLFTYYMTMFTGGNQRPVFFSVYPVTLDGYRYKTDLTGMDPNGWTLYGNDTGFFDSDGSTALYHDVIGNDAGIDAPRGVSGLLPLPSYPIFVSTPDPAAITALAIPLAPKPPTVGNLSFTGTTRTDNISKLGTGGSFSFTSNINGRYELVIDHNPASPTYDPTDPQNRLIRGKGTTGSNTVSWDGKDNSGNPFPVGNGYSVEVRVHGGEYHFPLLDDENNTLGGPTFTVLNPPYGPTTACPFAGRSGAPCTRTAFYDDRPYTTQDNTLVQTYTGGNAAAATLCYSVGNPPAPTHSDPVNGFDSGAFASGNSGPLSRSFGTDSSGGNGGNANTPCDGAFGDTKGLDLWTYTPSQANATTLNIFNGLSLSVASVHSDPFVVGQTNASYTVTVNNTSTQSTTGNIVVTYVVPNGLTVGTPSGGTGWRFVVSGQTVTATYSPALAGGDTAPTFIIPITTVGGVARTDPNKQITASSTGAVDATTADKTNVVQPDVDVNIAPSAPTFTVGSGGQYWTATVSNHNAAIATTGLTTLKATLPTGESFTATAPSGTGWSCSTNLQVLTCTRSDTLAGGTGSTFPIVTIPVAVSTPPATPRTDTVPATADTAGESRQATASGTVNVVQPGVSVTLTDNKSGNFIAGATGQQYTATVSNASATVATNGTTTLTVTLPAGESFTATAPSGTGWSCSTSGQVLTCTRSDTLAAGTTNKFPIVTIPVNVLTVPAIPSGGRTDNSVASADTANSAGPFPTNDLVTVNTALSLSVASAHSDPFVVGQTNAKYTVTVKDTSSQDTTGSITVTYVVPTGLTPGTPSGGTGWTFSVSGQTVTATYSPVLAAGATAPAFTIPISAVAGPATTTPYPNNQITAATSGAANATTSDPTNVVQPAVSVTITDNGSHSFTVGGSGQQYTATVTNSGTVATNGDTTLTVTLPAGETFNGTPTGTGWSCALGTGANSNKVTCTYSAVLGVGVSAPAVTIPVSVGNSPSTPRNDTVGASADTANSASPATNTDTVAISAGGGGSGGGGGGGGGGGTATPEAPSSILFGVGALAVLAAVQRRRTRTKAA